MEYIAPAPAVVLSPTPVVEYIVSAPAVIPSPAPVVESIAPAPVVQTPTSVVEYLAPAPAVVQAPTATAEHIAPVPAVFQAPTPAVEYIAPVPAVFQAPTAVVESFFTRASSVPTGSVSSSSAPGVNFSPAPAVFRVGGLQGSVPGQSSTSRRGHDLPLPSGWRRAEDASGRVFCWHVHTRQTRWTPPVTDDEDEDEEDEEDEDEDEEDEYTDEIYAESRFPAGFLPMRMCGWFPSGNCRQGWRCMFAHSVNELHLVARDQGP